MNTRFATCGAVAIAAGLLAGTPGCTAEEGALDVQRYELSGAFDWDAQRLDATVRITFTGGGSRVEFDSAVDTVKEVRGPGGEALPFGVEGERLWVDLPARSGEATTIAVSYEAAESENLRAIPPREGDPVPIRALFTDSEPRGASRWMPCNDRPDDRAEVAITMRMAADEAMISNGALVLDEAEGEERTMGYELNSTIPTYLMAFAISRFEVEAAGGGSPPVEVWHRAGVRGSYGPLLAELRREIELFEGLLGPYPWQRYTLVLLPEIPGMENAGITFQNEARSAEPEILDDLRLTAHELAHQWCGDLVTVSTWDDLWIKEGMATLLEAEAMRPFEDQGGKGTLFGDWLYPEDGVPARDPLRAPDDKYTSGAYSRGAWVFTQIRALVGEEAFWGTWRELLEAHRLGSVGTDDVIEAFSPHLGPEATERVRRSVSLRSLPAVSYVEVDHSAARLALHDPEGVLVAPFEAEWRRVDGTIERLSPAEDGSIPLEWKNEGDLLVLDPLDIHPLIDTFPWRSSWPDGDTSWGHDLAQALGGTAESIPQYDDIGGACQIQALAMWYESLVPLEAYPDFVASLDAESAKAVALQNACYFGTYSEMPEGWGAMVAAELAADPHTLGSGWTGRLCASVPEVEALFAPEWAAVQAGSVPPEMSLGRLHYIMRMTSPPGSAFETWSAMALGSDALRARVVAANRIRANAFQTADLVDSDEPVLWHDLVLDLLESNRTSEVLSEAIRATPAYAGRGGEVTMVPALVEILRSPVVRGVHWMAVCAAHRLLAEDAAAWEAFAAELDGAPLSHDAAYRLAFPYECY